MLMSIFYSDSVLTWLRCWGLCTIRRQRGSWMPGNDKLLWFYDSRDNCHKIKKCYFDFMMMVIFGNCPKMINCYDFTIMMTSENYCDSIMVTLPGCHMPWWGSLSTGQKRISHWSPCDRWLCEVFPLQRRDYGPSPLCGLWKLLCHPLFIQFRTMFFTNMYKCVFWNFLVPFSWPILASTALNQWYWFNMYILPKFSI